MTEAMKRRTEKVFAYATNAYNSIMEARFQLVAMQPIISDPKIIEPLSQTYAANTLSLLQWTLFCNAAINLCKGVLDSGERSASISKLVDMLDSQELIGALRTERAKPLPSANRPQGISEAQWDGLERVRQQRERQEEEKLFDAEYPKLIWPVTCQEPECLSHGFRAQNDELC